MIAFIGSQACAEWKAYPAGVTMMLVEPKMDGYRLNAIVQDDGTVAFYCRGEGQPDWAENLEHVAAELLALGPSAVGIMFDGEIMATSWNQTSSLLRRKRSLMDESMKERVRTELKFHVWDMIELKYAVSRKLPGRRKMVMVVEHPLAARRVILHNLFKMHTFQTLRLVPGWIAKNDAEADALYAEMLELGFEGTINKDVLGNYIFDRDVSWLKRKPVKTSDATIVGLIEGLGKHVGRLGAFDCRNAEGQPVKVGGGFTDKQREEYWAAGADMIGKVVEFKSQDDKVATARHPVFLRFRTELEKSA